MAVLGHGKPRDPISTGWLGSCHAAIFRRRAIGVILFALWGFDAAEALRAESDRLTEYEIKAGFLFNFTRFVEWPENVFADSKSPIILGIVGDNPFGNLLTQAAAGKIVNGRSILVKTLKEGEDLRSCQILFVALTDKKRVVQTLGIIRGYSVLTVGEGSGFTQTGGMIDFVVEGNKVRLEIDLPAASAARLKISAKVIAVARLVPGDSRGKN